MDHAATHAKRAQLDGPHDVHSRRSYGRLANSNTGDIVRTPSNALEASINHGIGYKKFFNTDKGFGFIKPNDGGYVFIPVSELQRSGIKFVMEGDRLSFEMGPGKNGRMATSQVATLAR